MIKLMMILSLFGLSLHAYGGNHGGGGDGAASATSHTLPPGTRPFDEGKEKPVAMEQVTEDLEIDMAKALGEKLHQSTAEVTCLQEPTCPYPARPVGEVATP